MPDSLWRQRSTFEECPKPYPGRAHWAAVLLAMSAGGSQALAPSTKHLISERNSASIWWQCPKVSNNRPRLKCFMEDKFAHSSLDKSGAFKSRTRRSRTSNTKRNFSSSWYWAAWRRIKTWNTAKATASSKANRYLRSWKKWMGNPRTLEELQKKIKMHIPVGGNESHRRQTVLGWKHCKNHHFQHPQAQNSHIAAFCHNPPPPRGQMRGDSSLWPRGTVPELPSGTKGYKTPIWPTLLTTKGRVFGAVC